MNLVLCRLREQIRVSMNVLGNIVIFPHLLTRKLTILFSFSDRACTCSPNSNTSTQKLEIISNKRNVPILHLALLALLLILQRQHAPLKPHDYY